MDVTCQRRPDVEVQEGLEVSNLGKSEGSRFLLVKCAHHDISQCAWYCEQKPQG